MTARFVPAFALSLLLLALASPALAAEWTWIGPDGGTVYSLALQPGSSDVLYAGTWSSVFKSVDGGATWRSSLEPMWDAGPANDLAVDPAHPATVYAVRGAALYRSADGGDHWTDVGQPIAPVDSVEVTPGGLVYAGSSRGVFRSADGGATWQALNRGLPEIRDVLSLAIDPSRPERVYVGLRSGGLYRTLDGGARWTPVGGSFMTGVMAIEVSPADPRTVYAAASTGVARSFDGGATWTAGRGLTTIVSALAAHPHLPGTVYAGAADGIYRSADRGRTWTAAGEGLTGGPVLALEIDPVSGALWAATADGGVFRSTDGGAHWTLRSHGLSGWLVQVLEADPHTPGTLFANLGRTGLVRSRDRGLHWTALPVPPNTTITEVDFDPVTPSIVYAASQTLGVLLKSTDGGDTWTALAAPPVLTTLAVDPEHPSVLYGGGQRSGFFKSVDGGATWIQSTGPASVYPYQIEAAPGVLYAAALYYNDPRFGVSRVVRSRNAGETWEVLANAPPIAYLAVSPSDPETVYAFNGSGVYRSTDGGDTWSLSELPGVASLALAPGPPETLYAAVPRKGVFASIDGGVTWTLVGEGLDGVPLGVLALDPHEPERLYVSTPTRGVAALYQPEGCDPGEALCLQGGRFRVEAAWADFQGNTGTGHPIPMTNETGALWFFDPGNVELVVKILDGRGTNGRFWVFAASLTSVEFTLTVTDTETGKQRVYFNPSGHMASFGDTDAF